MEESSKVDEEGIWLPLHYLLTKLGCPQMQLKYIFLSELAFKKCHFSVQVPCNKPLLMRALKTTIEVSSDMHAISGFAFLEYNHF